VRALGLGPRSARLPRRLMSAACAGWEAPWLSPSRGLRSYCPC
jgi:hypothetical protein